MKKFVVNIRSINWIDKESSEAEVLFEINGEQFWAFCHPCNFIENEIVDVCISFIEDKIPENTFWDENKNNQKSIIQSKIDKWSYYCYGQLISIHPVIIDCGVLTLTYGDWINDEKTLGCYVYFVIARLEIDKF
jgi:hypothetical protein